MYHLPLLLLFVLVVSLVLLIRRRNRNLTTRPETLQDALAYFLEMVASDIPEPVLKMQAVANAGRLLLSHLPEEYQSLIFNNVVIAARRKGQYVATIETVKKLIKQQEEQT